MIALQLQASAPPRSHVGPRFYLLHRGLPADGWISQVVPVGEFEGPYPFA